MRKLPMTSLIVAMAAISGIFLATGSSASAATPAQAIPGDHTMISPLTSLPAQQLVFYDNLGSIYSIYITGPNQNGVPTSVCWRTPGHTTVTWNWWWAKTTYVYPYYDSTCTGSRPNLTLWITPDGQTPYRCLIDTPPYSDWSCPHP